MAKYVVTHSCGHTEEVSLFGKESERERRIAWLEGQPCTECRAEEATGLTGSPRQRAWAADIREEVQARGAREVTNLSSWSGTPRLGSPATPIRTSMTRTSCCFGRPRRAMSWRVSKPCATSTTASSQPHTDARWWIDHRDTASSRVWREAREAQPDLYTLDQVIIGIRYAKANIEHDTRTSK